MNHKSTSNELTPFEKSMNNTATYTETIAYYERMAQRFDALKITPFGNTDSGNPLHEIIIDLDKDFDPKISKNKNKAILFINNAIHPGEPCGVDASMMLVRDLLSQEFNHGLLRNTVIVMIPFYNISGGLNRGSHSRVNQNGPEKYGFRGNIRNLDLNRDFIKCDSKNAQSFNQLFTKWAPNVFIDNHTSNGADYQYTMTLIPTQKDKLGGKLASFMTNVMLPELYAKMKKAKWEMTPYVYARTTPDEGIMGFLDLPRYSSGYGALHNVISMMPETHMLKPYKDRVYSTYSFMKTMIEHIYLHRMELVQAKKDDLANQKSTYEKAIDWKLNDTTYEEISFNGFEAMHKPSKVSGKERLFYDRSKPYTKKIKYFDNYEVSKKVMKPDAYIIPQVYSEIIDRLKWNGVEMKQMPEDQNLLVEYYFIESLQTVDAPFEGHYLHSDVNITKQHIRTHFSKGDYMIQTNQDAMRYIIETLEPQAPDSYFAWNFFDAILNQKEYFSPYVFEDVASKILDDNLALRTELEKEKLTNESLRNDGYAQLVWVYKRSKYYEKTHRRYPIARFYYK